MVSSPQPQLAEIVEEGFRNVGLLLMAMDAKLEEIARFLGEGDDEAEADS
jgi:hypothetical protein